MHPKLQLIFIDLEKQREKLLLDVSKLTPEQYHRSQNKKWPVSQILTHIWASERLSLGYMKKKSLGIEQTGNTGWITALKVFFLQLSQQLPLRYTAPPVVVKNTPKPLELDDLTREWNSLRDDVRTFLDKLEERHLRRKIYKHPVAGRLNVMQALRFFQAHIHHHLPQVKRHL